MFSVIGLPQQDICGNTYSGDAQRQSPFSSFLYTRTLYILKGVYPFRAHFLAMTEVVRQANGEAAERRGVMLGREKRSVEFLRIQRPGPVQQGVEIQSCI